MKTLVISCFLLAISASLSAQNVPYTMPRPDGWAAEQLQFPINYAPTIENEGTIDLRFSPGWSNPNGEEFWSYAFLWHLKNRLNSKSAIADELKTYFDGLINSHYKDTISNAIFTPTIVALANTATLFDDDKTFVGTIRLFDYISKKPLSLNCMVHLRTNTCGAKSMLFFEFSPMPFNTSIWAQMHNLWTETKCNK